MGEQQATTPTPAVTTVNKDVVTSTVSRQIPIVCPGHTRPLAELQFISMPDENNPTRTLLLSACHDRFPMVRDGITGDWIGTLIGHKGAVWCCRLDVTGNLAATASGDFSVQVWDAITGKSLYIFPHNHIVKTCDFSWNSKYLITGGHEGIIRIYHLLYPKQEPIHIKIVSSNNNNTTPITITKINWITNTIIAAGCGDGCIRIYDVSTIVNSNYWGSNDTDNKYDIEPIHIISTTSTENGIYEIRDMELSLDRTILSVACGYSVYFYKINSSYQLLKTYKMEKIHFKDEGGVSLHPNKTKFIVGGSDLWVRVYDYNTGIELECLKGHHGPIRCLRYSPTGIVYATGSEDGTIRLWNS